MARIKTLFWRIQQGIVFFFRAKTRYSVHSPFVSDFIKSVLCFRSIEIGTKIEQFRKKLLSDNRIIEITDFGAGYGGDQKKIRKISVSNVVKSSARTKRSGEFLARLAAWKKPQTALELGTNIGFSMLYLATATPTTQWHTIEGSQSLATLAKQHFQQFNVAAHLYVGAFQDTLPKILPQIAPIDFVLIDGHHTAQAVVELCQSIKPFLAPGAVVVIDDIRWTPDMLSAWSQIQQTPDFQVTIELFQTGICVFNRPQAKQKFQLLCGETFC